MRLRILMPLNISEISPTTLPEGSEIVVTSVQAREFLDCKLAVAVEGGEDEEPVVSGDNDAPAVAPVAIAGLKPSKAKPAPRGS